MLCICYSKKWDVMKNLCSVLHKGEEPGSFKKSQQGRKRDGAKGPQTREGGS